MSQEQWSAVDRFIADMLVPADPALDAALADSAAAGLPAISVSPNQGKLLHLLARVQGARHILEIGTLGGYSTIWLARALPEGGRLVTLEAEPKHAEVARANIARAGLADIVELRLGRALETLPPARRRGPRPLRPRLHRRRQAEHPRVFRLGAQAHPPGQPDHRRQRRAQGGGGRRRTATTPASRACAASTRCSRPSRASAPRRSRRWGARDTTASRWHGFLIVARGVVPLDDFAGFISGRCRRS